MNLFFDEVSQKLIINAKCEMFELKHPYVGSEHLLLAILKDTDLDVTKVLKEYGITYSGFKEELINVVGIGSKSNEWFLFTPLLKRIIMNATYYSKDNNHTVTAYSLFISILQEGDGVANRILLGMNIDLNLLYEKFLSSPMLSSSTKNSFLDDIAINMNQYSLDEKYDPVIGREEQINQLIQILLRKNKNNPLLIGDAGVGKTAIVEEVARRISLGQVPLKLKNKVIYNLSMSNLVAGTKYRGEFEEKFNKLIKEIINNPNIILFIDEVHTLMGAGGAEGAIDASNIIKPFLARGDMKVIGATTISEYEKFIVKDKALDRRFQKIYVEEPNDEEILDILLKLKPIYEKYHEVVISLEVLKEIINLSTTCIFNGRQPDKSIDLLDEVCSYTAIHSNKRDTILNEYEKRIKEVEDKKNNEIISHNFKKANAYKNQELKLRAEYNNKLFEFESSSLPEVTFNDLYNVLYKKANALEKNRYLKLLDYSHEKLKKIIFKQDLVLDEVFRILKKYDYITISKPMIFLFVGKNGVGKTFLVEELVKSLFSNKNFIHINLKEYKSEYFLSKLIGSPPGYVGYNEDGIFDKIKENPFSIILLDNFDCCHNSIQQFFLQSFEDGYITNSLKQEISLRKCIIFLTCTFNKSDIGFISSNKEVMLKEYPFSDKIQNIIYFDSIDEDSIKKYISKMSYGKNISKEKKKEYLLESDYSKSGFRKISNLIKENI